MPFDELINQFKVIKIKSDKQKFLINKNKLNKILFLMSDHGCGTPIWRIRTFKN
jgi:hypothetical protein